MKKENYLIFILIIIESILSSCNKDKIFVKTDDIIGEWKVAEGVLISTQYDFKNDYTLKINYSMTEDSCICTLPENDTFRVSFTYFNEFDFQKDNSFSILSASNPLLSLRLYEGTWEILKRKKNATTDSININIYSFFISGDNMDLSKYDVFDHSIKLIEENKLIIYFNEIQIFNIYDNSYRLINEGYMIYEKE